MNSALQNAMLPESGFTDAHGGVKIREFVQELGMDQACLAKALHTSRQNMAAQLKGPSRLIRPRDKEAQEFWAKLDVVVALVLALTNEKPTLNHVRTWFHTRNRALGMRRPLDLVYNRDLDTLVTMLMDVLNAAQGG